MSIELYPSIAKIKRNGVYENLPGFVPETGSIATQQMIATSESSATAQYVHNKGEYFRLNDTLYQAIVKINVGDAIVVGTNCEVAVLGNDVTHIANSIAPYELGIATSAHAFGEYFMVGETLYVATDDIQIGDSISTSTNCRLAVVGDELSELQTALSVNGIDGDLISPDIIKANYTELTTEIGNFYNSGYVIKTSANASYKRSLFVITNITEGILFFPFDNSVPDNGKMYFSSTETIDGTTENFIIQLSPSSSETIKKNVGLTKSENYYYVDIKKIKTAYPNCKALCPYSLATKWFTPYYYIPTTKILKWLNITDNNFGKIEPVVFWGDSMTRGATASYNNPYPKQFESLSGLSIVNGGVGGESTIDILAREGTEPIIVSPFTIPADTTAVEVTLTSNLGNTLSIMRSTDNVYWNINPCVISGIVGTLSYSDSKYYFTRSESGEAVTISRPVAVLTYAMKNLRDNPTVLWTQNNEEGTNEELLALFESFTNYIQSKKFILMSPTKGYGSAYAELESAMTTRYGRKYINLRKYLLEYGLDDLNITPTEQDTTDISQGVIPASLKTDSVHFTTDAYGIVAKLVYERGQELGYW